MATIVNNASSSRRTMKLTMRSPCSAAILSPPSRRALPLQVGEGFRRRHVHARPHRRARSRLRGWRGERTSAAASQAICSPIQVCRGLPGTHQWISQRGQPRNPPAACCLASLRYAPLPDDTDARMSVHRTPSSPTVSTHISAFQTHARQPSIEVRQDDEPRHQAQRRVPRDFWLRAVPCLGGPQPARLKR